MLIKNLLSATATKADKDKCIQEFGWFIQIRYSEATGQIRFVTSGLKYKGHKEMFMTQSVSTHDTLVIINALAKSQIEGTLPLPRCELNVTKKIKFLLHVKDEGGMLHIYICDSNGNLPPGVIA